MSEMVAGRLSLAEKAQKLFETTSVISTKLSRFEEQNLLESSSITHDAKNIEIPQNSALNLHYVPSKTFANEKTNGDMNASSSLGIIKENTRNTPANTNDIREDVKVPPSIVKEAANGRSKSETSLPISREPSISRKDSAIYKKNFEVRHDPPTNSIGLMSLNNSPAKEISTSSAFNHDQERIVLQNRIQELENLLLGVSKKSPKVITSDIANNFSSDQLKQENQDLKMKVSRKSMELKSLLEQNDSLRAENRRLIESEATMRTKLLDMSLPKSNPAEQLSSNEIISLERLVQKIEEQIGIAVIKTTALKSSFNIKRNQNPVEFIKDILEILLSSTRKLNQPIKNKMLLNLLIEITEILETVMEQSDQLIKGSFELDGRVQSLGIKSKELTAETDDMINNLKLIHQKKEKDWESKEKKHKKNISMLTERYQEILKENEKLLKTQEEIIQENEELVALARKPQPEPEIVVFENTDEELKKVLRLQKEEELNKLQCHINVLSKTIESWKSENEQLQKHLVELKGKQADSEKGMVQKLNLIADLESKYEDEKLKNQKAAELINSLTEQISKKKESNQIHSEFQHLQSIVDKNTSVKQNAVGKLLSSGDSTNEFKILKHVKEIGEKNREITVFTTKLNETAAALKKLKSEHEKLINKSKQTREKFHIREIAWLDKLKSFKDQHDQKCGENEELKQCLNVYVDQFANIQSLIGQGLTGSESHPLPFSTIFQSLFHQHKSIIDELYNLEQNFAEKSLALDEKCKELSAQIRCSEELDIAHQQALEKMGRISDGNVQLQFQIKELESRLAESQKARQDANDTLKAVISRTAQYISTEI